MDISIVVHHIMKYYSPLKINELSRMKRYGGNVNAHCTEWKKPIWKGYSMIPTIWYFGKGKTMLFKKYTFIFRSVFDPLQNWAQSTEFPYRTFSHTLSFPTMKITPEWYICYDEPTLMHYYHAKSIIYIKVHSWLVHSMGLDKCIMTCILITIPYWIVSLP